MGAPATETMTTETEAKAAKEKRFQESSKSDVGDTEGIDDSPKKGKKKKKSKSKCLDESAASLSLEKSAASLSLVNEESAEGPETPTKDKKKKKSKSSSSKGLDESAASLSTNNADDSAPDAATKDKKKTKSKGLDESAASLQSAEEASSGKADDVQKIIPLVTNDIWKTVGTASLDALCDLLQENEVRDYEKNRLTAIRIGAPLLIVRKMNDFENNTAIQTSGLNLLKCFIKMDSPPWFELAAVGGLERITSIVRKTEDAELRSLALSLLEITAAKKEAIKFLVEKHGITALVHVLRNQPDLMVRAVDALRTLCSTGDHLDRTEVAKNASTIIENSEDAKILVAAFALMDVMVATEELCKSLVEGKAAESLAYALKHFQDKPALIKKTFELLVSFATNGGKSARRAIAEQGTLETVEDMMSDKPKDAVVQKQSCDLIFAMSSERKAIKDSGVLPLISQIFTVHRKDKGALLKAANKTMSAVLS